MLVAMRREMEGKEEETLIRKALCGSVDSSNLDSVAVQVAEEASLAAALGAGVLHVVHF